MYVIFSIKKLLGMIHVVLLQNKYAGQQFDDP